MPDSSPSIGLFSPLSSPGGTALPDRIGKASMEGNTADFQKGGRDEGDAEKVIAVLGMLGADLMKLSGGLAKAGQCRAGRTRLWRFGHGHRARFGVST